MKTAGEPVYRLADYLDEHARTSARDEIRPGPEFWAAAAAHAPASDQVSLGNAAQSRGLYQAAARLFMSAARKNSVSGALALVTLMHRVHPDDNRPLRWPRPLICTADLLTCSAWESCLRQPVLVTERSRWPTG